MKKISLLLFCFSLSLAGFAQQEINTTFKTQMNTVFGNLDKTKVPHGILLDYGMEFTNVPAYNGTLTDSTFSDLTSLNQIYKTLLSSRIKDVSTGFVTPAAYDANWKSNRGNSFVAIGGLYFKYAQIAANAVTANKITVTNNVFYDKFISGVWQNPYQEFQTFAMSPAIKKYDGFNLTVKIPSAIFYSNYQSLVQNIQIDFGNGAGYVAVPFNQNVAVTYTTEGVKIWKYKLTLTNGTIMYNQSRIKILPGLNTIPYGTTTTSVTNPLGTPPPPQLYSKNITATKAYLGAYGTLKLTIDLGAGHAQITKPLIVAEGFDFGVFFNPENANGMNTYDGFQSTAFFSGSTDLRSLLTGNSLLLYGDQQYDIIYVDWDNGADYMQRNAYALEEAIKWVNEVKSGTEKNVILGQSMGGVIARYALADMEQSSLDHKTRLFVSHDAPQQGANIPVSVQYMYRHLTGLYLQIGTTLLGSTVTLPILENNFGVSNYLTMLDAPASKQLLSNFSTSSYTIDNTEFTSFYNELKGKGLANSGGYPVNCRNIAISNGAECGNSQNFNPGDDLVNFNWNKSLTFGGDLLSMVYLPLGGSIGGLLIDNDLFGVALSGMVPGHSKFNVEFNAKAMPYGTGNQIYKGKISYTKKVLWVLFNVTTDITNVQKNQPTGVLPMDTYGGGYFSTNFTSQSISIPGLYKRDNFGFIPTTSALDIGKRNVALVDVDYKNAYVGGTPPIAPKNSPFANFTTDFDNTNPNASNKQHISFDSRNGDWLALELQVNPSNPVYPNTNCSFVCSSSTISGSSTLCTTGIYTASAGATTYNWSITEGNSLVSLSGNGTNSITLTKLGTGSGYVTITATLSSTSCGSATIAPKRIWVGKPITLEANYISGGWDNVSVTSTNSFYINAVPGATSYKWYVTSIAQDLTNIANCQLPVITGSGTTVSVNWGTCKGKYEVSVKAINSCGNYSVDYKIVNVFDNSGGGGNPCPPTVLESYPNPVTMGNFEIDVIYPPCDDDVPDFRIAVNNKVNLYNLYGRLVYSGQFSTDNIKIETAKLIKGHYILNVTTAKGDSIRKIIIVE